MLKKEWVSYALYKNFILVLLQTIFFKVGDCLPVDSPKVHIPHKNYMAIFQWGNMLHCAVEFVVFDVPIGEVPISV